MVVMKEIVQGVQAVKKHEKGVSVEEICYLKKEEKQNTRQMYESIFEEDSKEFVDYYYQWKTKDNQIIVMEDQIGYEVMLHLNPYQIIINEQEVTVPYIVAVATRLDARRKGKMFRVMQQVLKDLQKAHCPFTFLLPANPAYYLGQGFAFAREDLQKAADMSKGSKINLAAVSVVELTGESAIESAVGVANIILAERYDVYVKRDPAYYERLIEEVASEQGRILLFKVQEQIIGILVYGGKEQAEIKEFLLLKQYEEKRKEICKRIFGIKGWKEEKMQMMFRITDLQALNGMLKGKQEVLTAAVTDNIVEENNGIWRLEWNQDGGSIVRTTKVEESKVEHLDISEVTEKIVEKLSVFIQEWV